MNAPGLPHHRRGPRIDERRDDEADRNAIGTAVAVLYVVGVISLVLFAFGALL